jgi:hypothetical protein
MSLDDKLQVDNCGAHKSTNLGDDLQPVRRQSSFCNFDSISMISDTTMPSEYVSRRIEEYKKHKVMDDDENKKLSTQYNLRFEKVVIVGGK